MHDVPQSGLSPVVADLSVLVDGLAAARVRAAQAFVAETRFFAGVAGLVDRRERERAQQSDTGARVSASQLAMREVYAEVGAALRLSEYQVASRVNQAHVLMTRFAHTVSEADAGTLSPQHAHAIADVGGGVDDADVRGEFERYAIDLAGELTPAQLKDALGVLVDRLDPEGTQQRIRHAVTGRSVRKRALEPGLGQLIITAPVTEVEGAYNRLADIASELHADNQYDRGEDENCAAESGHVPDERTRSQIMADVALDLLLTSAPDAHGATDERRAELGAIHATVHLTVPASTLAGTTLGGAVVAGAGPVDDHTARQLAGGSDDWYRVFVDPATGTPVAVDKRRPCTAMKRLLRARDETCRFPGCRRPAKNCDIDHTTAHADGGPTSLQNLAHLCERHPPHAPSTHRSALRGASGRVGPGQAPHRLARATTARRCSAVDRPYPPPVYNPAPGRRPLHSRTTPTVLMSEGCGILGR